MARARPALGRLDDGAVVVADPAEASRLHNRSGHGTPAGGALRLHPVEAAHLVEAGRLRLEPELGLAGLLGRFEGADVGYLAYRDLRERGLLVRPDGDAFTVWQRGGTVQDPPWFRLRVLPERAPLRAGDLLSWAQGGGHVSVVDEDGTVTQYALRLEEPAGRLTGGAMPGPPAVGDVLEDRVVVEDGADLHGRLALGTPLGGRLVLSFTEAEHLRRRGLLRLVRQGEDVGEGFPAWAARHQLHFTRTQPVYEDLRARGVLARSGFRFGTHLRGYDEDPAEGHARWLVQCAAPDDTLHWSEVSRAVRLAHGVRKTFCLAIAAQRVAYVGFEWFRP